MLLSNFALTWILDRVVTVYRAQCFTGQSSIQSVVTGGTLPFRLDFHVFGHEQSENRIIICVLGKL